MTSLRGSQRRDVSETDLAARDLLDSSQNNSAETLTLGSAAHRSFFAPHMEGFNLLSGFQTPHFRLPL